MARAGWRLGGEAVSDGGDGIAVRAQMKDGNVRTPRADPPAATVQPDQHRRVRVGCLRRVGIELLARVWAVRERAWRAGSHRTRPVCTREKMDDARTRCLNGASGARDDAERMDERQRLYGFFLRALSPFATALKAFARSQ